MRASLVDRLQSGAMAALILAMLFAPAEAASAQEAQQKRSWAQLPRLSRPLLLDGDLAEWPAVASIPCHLRSCLASPAGTAPWRGLGDLSADVFYGWNADGLCIGVAAVDDQVFNDRPDASLYQMDCLEVFVDGRSAADLMSRPYSKGAYQIFIRAPQKSGPLAIVTNARDGAIEGARAAGRRTQGGYAIEALIPWSAFPGLDPRPGARVGLAFQLDDYDPRDDAHSRPGRRTVMSYQAIADLWVSPSKLCGWELVEQPGRGPDVWLGPMVNMDVPAVIKDVLGRKAAVEVGRSIATQARAARLTLTDETGHVLLDVTGGLEPEPAPWGSSSATSLDLPAVGGAATLCTARLTITGAGGQALGVADWQVLFVGDALEQAMQRLERADVAAMAQTDPFRAQAWLGAAASVQRLRRAVALGSSAAVLNAIREAQCRMQVLEGSAKDLPATDLLDLLALTGDPNAEVIVEYPQPGVAAVAFNCGPMPLAGGWVRQFASADQATKSLDANQGLFAQPSEPLSVDGHPARLYRGTTQMDVAVRGEFNEAEDVLWLYPSDNEAIILKADRLAGLSPDGVVFAPGCPPKVKATVQEQAAQHKWPVVEGPEALKARSVLIAGSFSDGPVAAALAKCRFSKYVFRDWGVRLETALDARVVSVRAPSREVAEWVTRRIAAGRPVTAAQAEELRVTLVNLLAPKGSPPQAERDAQMFCGDVHMHTFYSDGNCSPAALMLEAMYCGLDYAVISDHNTIEGARLAARQLRRCGFAFPVVIGEEITTPVHMNAFPLRRLISWDRTPEETIETAHRLGAFIQWNHPWSDSDWGAAHFTHGLAGTEFDAWEHLPARYDEWKKAGTLPLITGSTDTHDGTFSSYGRLERTIVWARSADGADLAAALRQGRAVALVIDSASLFCGSDARATATWAALADGQALKEQKAQRIKAALRDADVARLVRLAEPTLQE